jgi:hypothetical protein
VSHLPAIAPQRTIDKLCGELAKRRAIATSLLSAWTDPRRAWVTESIKSQQVRKAELLKSRPLSRGEQVEAMQKRMDAIAVEDRARR